MFSFANTLNELIYITIRRMRELKKEWRLEDEVVEEDLEVASEEALLVAAVVSVAVEVIYKFKL